MIKMFGDGFERAIISQPPELSPLFAQCRWDWMKDGIKFSSIYRISQDEPMVQIMLRRCVCKFTQIAEYAGSISRIDYIRRMNFRPNSSYSYQFKNQQRKQSHKLRQNQGRTHRDTEIYFDFWILPLPYDLHALLSLNFINKNALISEIEIYFSFIY